MLLTRWLPLDHLVDESLRARIEQKLQVHFSESGAVTDCLRVYDSFDWRLWQSNALLLQCDADLYLFNRNSGKIKQQHAVQLPHGDLSVDELPAKLCSKLSARLRPRILFPRVTIQCTIRKFAVRDDEEKRIGYLQCFQAVMEDNSKTVFGICALPLRGYAQELIRVVAALGAGTADGTLAELVIEPQVANVVAAGHPAKPQLQFEPQTPTQQVLVDYLLANLAIAGDNIDGILADRDPEFLHDYRIALRRSRALSSLLKGVFDKTVARSVRQQLADLAKPTNPLRDLDVWLQEANHYTESLPDHMHDGFEQLLGILTKKRREALTRTRTQLRQLHVRDAFGQIEQRLRDPGQPLAGPRAEDPAITTARRVFHKHSARVSKLCSKAHNTMPDADIHHIRIECKKLRYLTELFKPVADDNHWTTITTTLKTLQDCLGYFNDLHVQQDFLQRHILAEAEMDHINSRVVLATGALSGLIHTRQQQAKQAAIQRLAGFADQLRQLPLDHLFGDSNASIEASTSLH